MDNSPTNTEYIEKARELFEEEGVIEIDEIPYPRVSREEDESGAYVQAWVWVPRKTIQPEWEGS